MAMMIMNNAAAAMSLGELNKNISQVGKQLKKLSSGQRIVGAGDDASGYSISEKMRVRIRALGQNERNVQNGSALLRVAEGGVQSQLEIMRTIKEKVIDADNDTNTDIDRATIQKEIDHGFRQIENIAWETTYNGKRLLVGDKVGEKVYSWVVDDKSSLLPGSDEMRMIDMNMIDDKYDTLNGIVGPFDLFTQSKIESATLDKLGFSPTIQFKGGEDNIYTFDSSFQTVDDFDGACLGINYISTAVVLTKNPNTENKYGGHVFDKYISMNNGVSEIDISGCSSVQDVMALIQAKLPSYVSGYGVNDQGACYLKTTKTLVGLSYRYSSGQMEGVNKTGLFSGDSYFSGGEDPSGIEDDDPDSGEPNPGEKASWSLSNMQANTGITVYQESGKILSGLKFVAGDGGPVPSEPYNGTQTVGIDYEGKIYFGGIAGELKDGTLTITSAKVGADQNYFYFVRDGIEEKKYEFLTTKPLDGTNDTKFAYATVDVSKYDDVEDLIEDLKGKAITFSYSNGYAQNSTYENGYPFDFSTRNEYFNMDAPYFYVEFVDTGSSNPVDGLYKFPHSIFGDGAVDLNALRADVAGGKSIAEAFYDCCKSSTAREVQGRIQKATSDGGQVIGVKIRASSFGVGTAGNNEKLFLTQNQLRAYTLDYGKWFDENPDKAIPDFLNNKGFRFYCASCDNQWFNIHFITEELPGGRPQNSDPGAEDIKHLYVDVSGVTDAESLVKAIYDQAMPQLTGSDPDLNHFMRLVADGDKLIIYDERRLTDSYLRNAKDKKGNYLYEYQWDDVENVGGAKIADGVWDNVSIGERDVYVRDLIIQDTDHASMNIRLRIPQTTMDHLFGYQAGTRDLSEFNVLTAKSREELLGNKAGRSRSGKYIPKDEKGLLDTAIDYLTNANTLIGAQNMRLGMTESNIVVQQENTTASESTIRDADMAKEMAEYTKASVLMQASQSMLAQANQNGSQVLGLLQ